MNEKQLRQDVPGGWLHARAVSSFVLLRYKGIRLHPSEGLSCKDYSTVLVVCFLGDGRAGHKGDLPHEHLRLQ